MNKIIRLTESDLIRLVKRVISEQPEIVSKTASKIDLNQQPTTEQKAMFKKQIDSCFSKYPKIKNYIVNIDDMSNLTSILWIVVAPDVFLTDNQIQVKKDYPLFEQCIKNVGNNYKT